MIIPTSYDKILIDYYCIKGRFYLEINFFNNLKLYEIDVDGALYRLFNDKDLYISLIDSFKQDNTIYELSDSIKAKAWNDAFTAAHALKGLAGNLGFISLLFTSAKLVVLIRKGEIKEIDEAFNNVLIAYKEVINAINNSKKRGL